MTKAFLVPKPRQKQEKSSLENQFPPEILGAMLPLQTRHLAQEQKMEVIIHYISGSQIVSCGCPGSCRNQPEDLMKKTTACGGRAPTLAPAPSSSQPPSPSGPLHCHLTCTVFGTQTSEVCGTIFNLGMGTQCVISFADCEVRCAMPFCVLASYFLASLIKFDHIGSANISLFQVFNDNSIEKDIRYCNSILINFVLCLRVFLKNASLMSHCCFL